MNKKVLTIMFCFCSVVGMDESVAQFDAVGQVGMRAYRTIILPYIEHLQLLRMQLEKDLLAESLHGIFVKLLAVRRAGFKLLRAYHRFDAHVQRVGCDRSLCAPARRLMRRFIGEYASWVSDQLNDFFSTIPLSDIFITEQIDWTEPFIALQALLDEHEDSAVSEPVPVHAPAQDETTPLSVGLPHIEDEPCVGLDLIELSEGPVITARRGCCWFCRF